MTHTMPMWIEISTAKKWLSEGCSEFQTEPQGPEVVQLDRNATVFPRTIYLHSDVHCDMIHVSRATEHT